MGVGLGPMAAVEPSGASALAVGSVGQTLLGRGWGLLLCPALGLRGGQEGAVQGSRGGFPQRGLSVFKYSAYKRGQEFPA